jgi:hypothetical protein
MLHGLGKGGIAFHRVGAVDLGKEEIGEIRDQARDVSSGRVHFDRNRDGVAVVFDNEQNGQPRGGGRADRFPEFSFAGRTLTQRDVHHFISMEMRGLERAVVSLALFCCPGMGGEVSASLRAAHCLGALGGNGRGLADNIQPGIAPVGGHLAAAAGHIACGSDGLQQHFLNRIAQSEAERAIAIVGIEPVIAGLERHACGHQQGLMACTGDLKKDLLLPFQ